MIRHFRYFMNLRLLVLFCAFLIAAPDFAGSSEIRVINEDGSISVIDMNADPSPPPETAVPSVPGPGVAGPEMAAPIKKSEAKPGVKKEPLKKTGAKKPSKKSKNKAKKQKNPDAPFRETRDVKALKNINAAQETPPDALPNQHTPPPRARLPDGRITPEEAQSIALENAPPARRSFVLERTYEGKKVYVVTFVGDSGNTDILIDAISGTITGRKFIPR
jgi:uncharacterized membrane protein YkoI